MQGAPAIDETQPVEGLWPSLKGMELANLTSPSLAEVVDQGLGIVRVCLNSWDDVGRPPRALRVAHVQARSSSIDGCGSAASFQFVVKDDVHGV